MSEVHPAWATLLVLPLIGLGLQARDAARAPGGLDRDCAADAVRADWKEGDILRFEPAWADAAWSRLPELPVDRAGGREAEALEPHSRLWTIASDGLERPGTRATCGPLTVHLEELPGRGRPRYEFVDHLAEAKLVRTYDGAGKPPRIPGVERADGDPRKQECARWEQGRWRCRRGRSWEWVGPVTRDVDDAPRHGIWFHPLDKGHKLDLIFPAVPLGRELQVEGGLTLRAANAGTGAPVIFQVHIGEQAVLDVSVGVDEKGWHRWSVDTSRWAGKTAPVRFRVSTADHQTRQWLFAGRTWRD